MWGNKICLVIMNREQRDTTHVACVVAEGYLVVSSVIRKKKRWNQWKILKFCLPMKRIE